MKHLAHKLSLWLPLVFYLGTIFFLSTRAVPSSMSVAPDYILHGLEYFFLGVFMIRALNDGFRHPVRIRTVWLGLSLCLVCAVIDEIVQRNTPGRVSSVLDVMSDGTGSALAAFLFWMVRRILISPVRPERG